MIMSRSVLQPCRWFGCSASFTQKGEKTLIVRVTFCQCSCSISSTLCVDSTVRVKEGKVLKAGLR